MKEFSSTFQHNPKFLFDDLVIFNFQNFSTLIFSPVNHLLILSIHGAKHDWDFLSLICDISEFLNFYKNMNWDEVLEKAERIGIKRILLINLILAKDLFQLDLSDKIANELKSDLTAQKIANDVKKRLFINKRPLNLFRKSIFDFKKRKKIKYGFKDSLYGLIKPSYADFQILPLSGRLFYLYYIIRPLLLLKRYR